MKIVVIGGTGLIGSKLVTKLSALGHEAVAAAPNTGVNTLTGEGLAEVLKGAQVVVDVSNSPSFEDAAVMDFFQTSTRNLLSYEAAAGVGHHVALSVVGTDRLAESGYFRAKIAQERLIKESSIPYTIVQATQFFEFVRSIAAAATDGNTVRLAPVLIQPMAADDVARAVGRVTTGSPLNGTIEIAGPEQFRLDEFIKQGLRARNDPREVVADPQARYFGAELGERTLVPEGKVELGKIRFEDWTREPANLAGPGRQPAVANPVPTGGPKANEVKISDVPPGSGNLKLRDLKPKKESVMSTITTKDGTEIYYKDWGAGPAVTFSHGWPLNADMWDGQMLFLAQNGFRVVAHDRRGHGRSTQASSGNDMNGYADDLAAVIEALDLKQVTLVGHSTGGGEVARYIGRHGTSRVAKAVLIAAVPPLMLKSDANPEGLPMQIFDDLRAGLMKDRSQTYRDFAVPFYGANQGVKVSQGILDQFWSWSMQSGLKNAYESIKAFSETDFTEDLKKFDVPTLVLHGEDDQIVPVKNSARKSAQLIKGAKEIYYPGAPHGITATHQDQINADLLAFITEQKSAAA